MQEPEPLGSTVRLFTWLACILLFCMLGLYQLYLMTLVPMLRILVRPN